MRNTWFVAARETQEVNIFMPIQKLAMRLQSGAVTPSNAEKTTMPLLIREEKKVLHSQNFDIQFKSSRYILWTWSCQKGKACVWMEKLFIALKSVPTIIIRNYAGLF